jgi:maltose/moltooligosaccharide transporter
MIIGQVTGFFVAPIVGSMADNSTNKMGRRRPYLILGAVTAAIS